MVCLGRLREIMFIRGLHSVRSDHAKRPHFPPLQDQPPPKAPVSTLPAIPGIMLPHILDKMNLLKVLWSGRT